MGSTDFYNKALKELHPASDGPSLELWNELLFLHDHI